MSLRYLGLRILLPYPWYHTGKQRGPNKLFPSGGRTVPVSRGGAWFGGGGHLNIVHNGDLNLFGLLNSWFQAARRPLVTTPHPESAGVGGFDALRFSICLVGSRIQLSPLPKGGGLLRGKKENPHHFVDHV